MIKRLLMAALLVLVAGPARAQVAIKTRPISPPIARQLQAAIAQERLDQRAVSQAFSKQSKIDISPGGRAKWNALQSIKALNAALNKDIAAVSALEAQAFAAAKLSPSDYEIAEDGVPHFVEKQQPK
jgi:hypothetical protein